MQNSFRVSDFIARWNASLFAAIEDAPWRVAQSAEAIILAKLDCLDGDYRREGQAAVHRTAKIEAGAIIKSAVIIGKNCFVAAGAYLRGGVFLDDDCIVGPNSELKTSFMFEGSKLAHLNFVGDSILGAGVNVEAGAIIANYRNECDNKSIRFRRSGAVVETGVHKFGALVGDGCKIGANSVIAPGAILDPGTQVPRLTLLDQRVDL